MDENGDRILPTIGHVHLKVANLERSIAFYSGLLGLEVTQRLGNSAAFLSWGGYHHHLGLNTWESEGGSPPAPGTTGLFHTAFRFSSREALARVVRRVLEHGVLLDGTADHGVSEAVYLRDPDNNGVELYCDRPKSEWPVNEHGELKMFTKPLDLNLLLGIN